MWCPTDPFWGLCCFLYINDLPKVCKFSKVFFADDTNVTGLNCLVESFNQDLEAINKWLVLNKLSLNMDKTVQVSVSLNSASNQQLLINSIPLKIEGSCKYLQVYVDAKL